MDVGIKPPLTGRIAVNPWSVFNISGQFVCEAFGLIAPGMPQTASKIGLHYTHVTIDGEPAQSGRSEVRYPRRGQRRTAVDPAVSQ